MTKESYSFGVDTEARLYTETSGMTAKRFQYNVNKNCIECDGKFVAYLNSVDGFRIANKLTVLAEENEQLKKEVDELEQENEQLENKLWNCQNYR